MLLNMGKVMVFMEKTMATRYFCCVLACLVLVFGVQATYATRSNQSESRNTLSKIEETLYSMVHSDILTTVFWIGERAKPKSGWSDNLDSAWDGRWKENFGGLDSPIYRIGYFPSKFRPKQNPFYVALPFNDISNPECLEASPVLQHLKQKKASKIKSVCKNRWIEMILDEKKCYAQWQDVGPVFTNDYEYVFQGEEPRAHSIAMAGLDVSPAVRDYLSFKGKCRLSWRFVDESQVPEGPWKTIVTRS